MPQMADAAIIATQDQMHYHLAMQAIEVGYHLLLEKPAAPTPEECWRIEDAANKKAYKLLYATFCDSLRFFV